MPPIRAYSKWFFQLLLVFSIGFDSIFCTLCHHNYTTDWKSLDTRPNPLWFDEAKIGVMMHWGVYAAIPCSSEWFNDEKWRLKHCAQYVKDNLKTKWTYQEFASKLTTENFDADEWMEIIKESGAKYVIPTTKHHDGYTLWPSKYSSGWNSVDVGPHRDLIGELATATRKANLTFGFYHSMMEWYNPLFMMDKRNSYGTQEFVNKKCLPELKELVIKYKPDYIWSDGDWYIESPYWKSTEFLAWLYNNSPVRDTVLVNDRWGKEIPGHHGSVFSKERINPQRYIKHTWEFATTLDLRSWGYRPDAPLEEIYETQYVIDQLVSSVSCGGNFIINIGPTDDGRISPIFEERLRYMGSWLKVNGEAIYSSRPWIHQKDSKAKDVWYTKGKSGSIYAIVLRYPESNNIDLYSIRKFVTEKTKVSMLGYEGEIKMIKSSDHVAVEFPPVYHSLYISEWGWTFAFTNV